MSEEKKNLSEILQDEELHTAPVLSLGSQTAQAVQLEKTAEMLEQAASTPLAQDAKEIVESLESGLTEAELKEVEEFAGKIDLMNQDHVMMYGADAQKKISSFADSILDGVKTMDTGDVGETLTKLITELKGCQRGQDRLQPGTAPGAAAQGHRDV